MVRRLIAVGVGVGFLILLVVGFRGCLEARSDRGLRNYGQDIGTIMAESEQRGKDFFEAIEDSGVTPIALKNKVASLRGASEQLLDRAENLSVPGQMDDAQSATTLALRLRRDSLGSISDSVTEAAGDAERADSIDAITTSMGAIYASDILWSQVAVPEITSILDEEDVDAPELPAGNFMPEGSGTQFLDQTEIATLFSGVSGSDEASGEHGLGLVQTTLGDTTLDPDTTNTVPDDANTVGVEIQNQGSAEENGIGVTITVDGDEFTTTVEAISPGETATANIDLNPLPQPGSEVTIDVVIDPVAGESITENNQSSYTVVFGAATG